MSDDSKPFNGDIPLKPGVTFSAMVALYHEYCSEVEITPGLDLLTEGEFNDDDAELYFSVKAGILTYEVQDGCPWNYVEMLEGWIGEIEDEHAAAGWVEFIGEEPEFRGPTPIAKAQVAVAYWQSAVADSQRALDVAMTELVNLGG